MKNNDADSLHCHLRPVEQVIVNYARAHSFECFCWLEFASQYNNNTVRNAFSQLVKLKLLDRCCRSSNAYYILHNNEKLGDGQKVTITHMGVATAESGCRLVI